jgi:hypothetical protein
MAGTYLEISCCLTAGGGGSAFFGDPVANFAALPSGDPDGTIRLTLDTGVVYTVTADVWDPIDTELASVAVNDTNSIDLTVTGGVLSADLKLSAAAAGAGFFKATNSIQADGIRTVIEEASGSQTGVLKSADWTTFNNKVSTSRTINTTAPITGGGDLSADRTIAIPQANGSTDGYLDNADWTTFNSKEPAITSGSTSQFWRGDKSFQTLNTDALTARTDGASPATGKIGETLQASQGAFTATGVAASGSYGSVTSVSLSAGLWIIHGVLSFEENGAVLTQGVSAGLSDTSNGSNVGAFGFSRHAYQIITGENPQFSAPPKLVSLSGTTTYYLNSKFDYTSGAPRHKGEIWAVRIG